MERWWVCPRPPQIAVAGDQCGLVDAQRILERCRLAPHGEASCLRRGGCICAAGGMMFWRLPGPALPLRRGLGAESKLQEDQGQRCLLATCERPCTSVAAGRGGVEQVEAFTDSLKE